MTADAWWGSGSTAVIVAFVVLGACYAFTSPPFENPDEVSHAEYATFIAERGRPAVVTVDCIRIAFHPPLYHALLAPIALLTDTRTEDLTSAYRVNPEWPASPVVLTHGYPREHFPYSGSVRFLMLARLATLAMAAGALVYTRRLARHVLGDERDAAVAVAVAVVAMVPQFQYLAASVNHDGLAATVGAAFLYYCVRLADAGARADAIKTGVALGVGLLVKSSFVALAPLPLLAVVLRGWRASRRDGFGRVATIYGIAIAVAGWWYAWSWWQYGSPIPTVMLHQTTWLGTNLVRTVPMDWANLRATLGQVFQSFWFLAGVMRIAAPPWMYVVWGSVSALAIIGLVASMPSRAAILLLAAVGLCVAAIVQYNLSVYSSQGRYLFIVLPALGIGAARAVTLPALGARRVASGLVVAAVVVLAVTCFATAFAPVYAAIEPRPEPATLETRQIQCRNRYTQTWSPAAGVVDGIELTGRRGGAGDFTLELAVSRIGDGAVVRRASITSAAIGREPGPLVFRFAPLAVEPNARYELALTSADATPVARAARTYRPAGDGTLAVNGIPLAGALELRALSARDAGAASE